MSSLQYSLDKKIKAFLAFSPFSVISTFINWYFDRVSTRDLLPVYTVEAVSIDVASISSRKYQWPVYNVPCSLLTLWSSWYRDSEAQCRDSAGQITSCTTFPSSLNNTRSSPAVSWYSEPRSSSPWPVISETVVKSVRLRYCQYLETRGKKYFWNSICVGWGRTVPFLSWCHYTDTTQFLVLHDAYFHWSVYMVQTQN